MNSSLPGAPPAAENFPGSMLRINRIKMDRIAEKALWLFKIAIAAI